MIEILVGDTGQWEITAPFVLEDAVYTCTGVSSMESLESLGVSVLSSIYGAVGLDATKYLEDKAADVKIITLKKGTGNVVNIPSSFISAAPEFTVVDYSRVMVGVDLGVLPDSLDLSYIAGELEDKVNGSLGITTSASVRRVPIDYVMSQEKHQQLESTRLSNVSVSPSNFRKLQDANAMITTLNIRIDFLEQIITANYT